MTNSSRFARESARAAGFATVGMAGVALALAALNRLVQSRVPVPQPPLAVEPQAFAWSEGEIAYSVAGHGPAVILLHGIYAGASSYEFRKIFQPLSQKFRVFAPDLPGFGLSTRTSDGAANYSPDLFITFIRDFVQQVAGGADHPVHVIASSLTCAYVIEAALTRPDIFDRLVLIEPAGIDTLSQPPTVSQRILGAMLRLPVLGDTLYNALVSRAGLRYFLMHQVYRKRDAISDDLIDAYYVTSHQPPARFAIASFIGGELNLDIADTYEALPQPVLICWGKDSEVAPVEFSESFIERNTNAELLIFDRSGALPHDEEATSFVSQVSQWLGQHISSFRR